MNTLFKHIRGFTLIEIMMVMAVVALIMGFILPQMGIISSYNLKSAAQTIAGMIRVSYDRAAIKNRQYRLVFDFEENTVWSEYLLPEETTVSEAEDTEKEEVSEEKEDAEKKNQEESESQVVALGTYEIEDSELLERYSLPSGVKLAGLESTHNATEVKSGQDFIVFLPNGFAEKSHIHLAGAGDTVFTLEVNPVTGNTKVHDEYTPMTAEAK
jgi:prepilin-type N-terminal cleavage/methylation domain-containing protein